MSGIPDLFFFFPVSLFFWGVVKGIIKHSSISLTITLTEYSSSIKIKEEQEC